ncbi:cytochrome P450 [Xylaria cf. heliscus]|nr:cytochrome P450 [Xylaria cf. heliscus]
MGYIASLFTTIPALVALGLCLIASLVITLIQRRTGRREAPMLNEFIPFVSNTYQYLTDMGGFLNRATTALAMNGIVRFRLGRRNVYLVSGTDNIQALCEPPHIMDPNTFHILLMQTHWGITPHEIKKFQGDVSGRKKIPLPGTENIPLDQRHWYNHHQIYAEYLSSAKYTQILANTFLSFFSEKLDRYQLLEWTSVSLFDFLKTDMAESAIASIFGTQILSLNPEMIKAYWEFDEVAGALVFGLPRLIKPRPWRVRERLHNMVHRHVQSAWLHFNWDGPEAELDWDPHWGSRFSREIAKWLRGAGFTDHTISGHTTATLFGLNGNTLPIATWILMELVQDQKLAQLIRKEVSVAFTVDPNTGKHEIDIHKLLSLPRLLSVYTEVLRLHISFNATREVRQDISINNFSIAKGSLVQAPSQIVHYDEYVWGIDDHPASEFWAERHLEYVDETGDAILEPHFLINARPTSFFPFGLGYALCPGRHFAKREILLAVAIIINKFEIEMIEWMLPDGTPSDRPARSNQYYAGTAAMPPDREMKIRWKRMW